MSPPISVTSLGSEQIDVTSVCAKTTSSSELQQNHEKKQVALKQITWSCNRHKILAEKLHKMCYAKHKDFWRAFAVASPTTENRCFLPKTAFSSQLLSWKIWYILYYGKNLSPERLLQNNPQLWTFWDRPKFWADLNNILHVFPIVNATHMPAKLAKQL